MNSITELLDLEDTDIFISDILIQGTTKTLTLETNPVPHFCPLCGFRMYSRGIKKRTINHPVFQDGFDLTLILKQRRWRCTNPNCSYDIADSFKFVNKNRRTTNATDMLIVNAYRNLLAPTSKIASRFHVSDTYALDVFDRYVKLDRLPLPDIISVDEVFTNLNDQCKYALVLQDFYTGDPIDLLRSRRVDVTEPYFVSIPREERNQVKYLISDMYNQYVAYVDKYFPNAAPVIDSFHVMQWIVHRIDNYIRQLLKKYRQRDRALAEKLSEELGREIKPKKSDEVYLLQKYKWIVLSNVSNINYRSDARLDNHFRQLMNTYDYEDAIFRIDPKLQEYRNLKEIYAIFNSRNEGSPLTAAKELPEIIDFYKSCKYDIFREFGDLLEKYQQPIINSFIMVEKYGQGKIYSSRLSNGPIEAMNRKVKDLKRMGRGFRNFEHMRNRFLYATRKNPILNGVSDYNPVTYFEENEF